RNSLMTMPPPAVGAAPVPLNAIVTVPPLLEMVNVALLPPAVVGTKVTVAVADALGASANGVGAATWNCEAPAPEIASVFTFSVVLPMLVSVSGASPDAPSATGPNASAAGETESTGARLTIVTVYGATPRHPSAATARTVNVKVPPNVGVPERIPSALSDNPSGGAPAAMEKVYGPVPPLAVSVCEYGTATVPPANVPPIVIAEQLS